jgi:hypothetical protein
MGKKEVKRNEKQISILSFFLSFFHSFFLSFFLSVISLAGSGLA